MRLVKPYGEILYHIKKYNNIKWKIMYEVVREMKERKVKGVVYCDGWPKFTTMITQEFSPKLSEVADFRFATDNEEILLELLTHHDLVTWTKPQLIYYVDDYDNPNTSFLSKLNRNKPELARASSVYFSSFFKMNLVKYTQSSKTMERLPKGYILGTLNPNHANFIAKVWFPEYSRQKCEDFLVDNICQFKSVAVYDAKQPEQPVAWFMFKAGGMMGMRYTTHLHRRKKLSQSLDCMSWWIMALYDNPGYREMEDDMLSVWKMEQNKTGQSYWIWNYPSLQK